MGPQAWEAGVEATWEQVTEGEDGTISISKLVKAQQRQRRNRLVGVGKCATVSAALCMEQRSRRMRWTGIGLIVS